MQIDTLLELIQKGDFQAASKAVTEAIIENPKEPEVYVLQAKMQALQGQYDLASFSWLLALGAAEDKGPWLLEYGKFLFRLGRREQAAKAFFEATTFEQQAPTAWVEYGKCLDAANNYVSAESAYQNALDLDPANVSAMLLLSNITALRKLFGEAIDLIDKAVALAGPAGASGVRPLLNYRVTRNHYKRMLYDWDDNESLAEELSGSYLHDNEALDAVSPFSIMSTLDSPEVQLKAAKCFQKLPHLQRQPLDPLEGRDCKIRVGWFGADFNEHATMFLMMGVFRDYDRVNFEFNVFSYGEPIVSNCRARVSGYVDNFYDLYGSDDQKIIDLARSKKLHIAIDMKLFTSGARLSLFASGLAPLQIQYLGYPGTSGKDYFDYIIADRVVVPENERHNFTEAIMFMPGSYQPNDPKRVLTAGRSTRSDWCLPEDAFVFVAFHQPYKIGPTEFSAWLKLMARVENSVLWLWDHSLGHAGELAKERLRQRAEKAGVDGSRLIFSGWVDQQMHLERLSHGDLFLDCFLVNGHTTISDALFVGLPAVTKPGRQFASRVGASLVSAAGIPELIAYSLEDYVDVAARYATDRSFRESVTSRLTVGLQRQGGLYDSETYCRNLEGLLQQACDSASRGDPVQDLFFE
jgi:predicted O-linked N-acetylglucosamine transferase (SPINDLY family)